MEVEGIEPATFAYVLAVPRRDDLIDLA